MHFAPWLLGLIPFIAIAAQAPRIEGALNFRDIGGLRTADGRQVRRGVIYRSGELNSLTEADREALAALKIRYIFDTRTDAERAAAPTNWTVNPPVTISRSVGFDAKEDPAGSMKMLFKNGFEAPQVAEAMGKITAKIALDGAAIGEILRAVGQGDEPAIIHCTAGKDRTGVLTAVLLTVLGVPKDAVYADYLQSNAAVPAQMMRLKAAANGKSGMPSGLSALPVESIKVLMGVERGFLDAAFAAIDEKYGSFSGYMVDGLKFGEVDVAALRARLLEQGAK